MFWGGEVVGHSLLRAGRRDVLSQQVREHDLEDFDLLTGTLGLITTLGGSCPWRPGVLGPPDGLCPPPRLPNRSGAAREFWPGFSEPGCGWRPPVTPTNGPPSPGGSGLLRGSMSAVVDDEGVTTGDWAASRDPLDCDGDDVPSFESLFLDLEDLFGSFARESCSC